MSQHSCTMTPSPDMLLDIIRVQSAIVKLGLDLGGVMDFVANEVQALTQAAGAVVELVEDQEMVYRAASGIARRQLGLRIRRAGSLSGLCIETGEVLRCSDCESDDRVDREACRRVGLRSMVVAPLVCNEAVVGVLKVLSPRCDGFSEVHVCILRLMSELIAAAMFHAARDEITELYFRATHDALTGLANRAMFHDRLRQSLAQARRHSLAVGLLNLDMDGLKRINDTYGHRAGDAAIKELALRIARSSRQSDLVARLGGDEFGIILPGLENRNGIERTVARINEEMARPFAFENNPLAIEASIGTAIFPDEAKEIEALIERADQAMYAMKKARRDGRDG